MFKGTFSVSVTFLVANCIRITWITDRIRINTDFLFDKGGSQDRKQSQHPELHAGKLT